MSITLHGVIHGSTIQLASDPGLADGQAVQVVVQPAPKTDIDSVPARPNRPEWGRGILASAGILAEDPEDDRILDKIREQRRNDFGRSLPE